MDLSAHIEPPRRTILFAHARSGSTSLCRVLQCHPLLNFALEPFHHRYAEYNPGRKNHLDLIHDMDSLDRALDEIFGEFNGIKILDYQLPEELYSHLLLSPGHTVIYLRRRNLLQAAVSGWIAKQTGVWQISDMSEEAQRMYQRLEPALLDKLADELAYGRLLERHFGEVVRRKPRGTCNRVWYEDLFTPDLAADRATAAGIFRFLGLDLPSSEEVDRHLDPARSRLNSPERYALVPNAMEIDERLGCDSTGWLFPPSR